MTPDLAIEYIARRMAELCQTDYHLRFRHFRLGPQEQRYIQAYTDLFILVDQPIDAYIHSDIGVFDLTMDEAVELQYEHRGMIHLTNYSIFPNHIRFIQVIPKF